MVNSDEMFNEIEFNKSGLYFQPPITIINSKKITKLIKRPIVYVGAVAVLFLFVVMMLNVVQQKNTLFESVSDGKHIPVGLLVSLIIFFELIIVIGGWKYKPDLPSIAAVSFDNNVTNTHSIGNILYTEYIHLFQLSGMILLVAMVGAIVLTFNKRTGIKRQSYIEQISREKDTGVSLVDVKINTGVKIDD